MNLKFVTKQRYPRNPRSVLISTYLPILVLELNFTFEGNVSFVVIQKNIMGEKTLTDEMFRFVRHVEPCDTLAW